MAVAASAIQAGTVCKPDNVIQSAEINFSFLNFFSFLCTTFFSQSSSLALILFPHTPARHSVKLPIFPYHRQESLFYNWPQWSVARFFLFRPSCNPNNNFIACNPLSLSLPVYLMLASYHFELFNVCTCFGFKYRILPSRGHQKISFPAPRIYKGPKHNRYQRNAWGLDKEVFSR